MRVAVTRTIPERGLRLLREFGDVVVWPEQLPPSRERLIDFARGADGLLSLLTEPIDAELLEQLPSVRVVSNFAVGFDNIDVPACTARGVAVCTTPDVLTDTTADFAFALLLASARRVVEAADSVPRGEWKTWEPMGFMGQDVAGATIGVIGFGRIGVAMAKRARGFGMRILYTDAIERPEAERELGAEQLAMMKPNAVLVNTSRGPVVDNDALADALEAGTIWGAALDVTDPEPLPAGHRLVGMPNCIITPHVASATEETRSKMSEMAARNLIAVLSGEQPLRCLNPDVLRG